MFSWKKQLGKTIFLFLCLATLASLMRKIVDPLNGREVSEQAFARVHHLIHLLISLAFEHKKSKEQRRVLSNEM